MANTIDILIKGGRPDIIGVTQVTDEHIIKFRCTYPDNSGRTDSTVFMDDYSTAKEWFDKNKDDLGDVHFFACLINKIDYEAEDFDVLDEELIHSFWDEETGM